MDRRSAARTVSLALACGGVAALIGASAIGTRAAYFDTLIVAGVDALAIGGAGQILLLIFFGKKRPSSPVGMHPSPRSLEKSAAYELKAMLVQQLSREKPVIIGFPPDPEAQRFAQQIATFLDNNGFRIVGFAAELPPVPFEPVVGIDVGGNRVMVGAIKAAVAPPAEPL